MPRKSVARKKECSMVAARVTSWNIFRGEGAITLSPECKSPAYKKAGVNIDAAARFVQAIAPLARRTRRPGSESTLGGFGGLFDLKAAGFCDPILYAANDGVGTKLKVAIETGRHDTVGIDLVAMCVNDLVVQGAEPLFFLDYFAAGSLRESEAYDVIQGISHGCQQAGCALIGGETAEMPGLYADQDYDLAGFAVGAVERGSVIDGASCAPGDVVLGLSSSGLHSNGYSLVRKIVADKGYIWADPAPFAPHRSLADEMLTPTRIYVKSCLHAARTGYVKAFAHITGGGFFENIPRIIPPHVSVCLMASCWSLPPVFSWLRRHGVTSLDMAHTFNCGIGMVVIVSPRHVDAVTEVFLEHGETCHVIGQLEERSLTNRPIYFKDLEMAWN